MVCGGLGPPAEPLLGRWSATIPSCALLSPLTGKLPGLSLHASDEAAGDRLHGALQLIQVQLLGPFQQASLARGQGRLGGVACLVLRRGIRVLQDRSVSKGSLRSPLSSSSSSRLLDLTSAILACFREPAWYMASGYCCLVSSAKASLLRSVRSSGVTLMTAQRWARVPGGPASLQLKGLWPLPHLKHFLPSSSLWMTMRYVGGKPSRLPLAADKGQQVGPLVQLHGDVDAVVRHALEPGHHVLAQPDDPAEMAQDCDQGAPGCGRPGKSSWATWPAPGRPGLWGPGPAHRRPQLCKRLLLGEPCWGSLR
jgi:hypothetical protein